MKLICIGDNVVDCYLDEGVCYPGGDAVNVAVHAKRCGAEKVTYIGVFGNDAEAEHLIACMQHEGVEVNLSRRMYAASSHPGVKLNATHDRMFVGGPRDTVQQLVRMELTQMELNQLADYDLCHTTCYSMLEHEIKVLSDRIPLSFDFSTYTNDAYIDQIAPHVDYAFFSGAELSESQETALVQRCELLGVKLVVVTRGEAGASAYQKGQQFRCLAKPVVAVDTMGAGDSFIAAFLTSWFQTKSPEMALRHAVEYAAHNCLEKGAFGYPMTLPHTYAHRVDPMRERK